MPYIPILRPELDIFKHSKNVRENKQTQFGIYKLCSVVVYNGLNMSEINYMECT